MDNGKGDAPYSPPAASSVEPDEEEESEDLSEEVNVDLPVPDMESSNGKASGEEEPLLDLKTAVERIPEELRREMEELLRADFREVIRWKPRK